MSIDSIDYYKSRSKVYEQNCSKVLEIIKEILSSDLQKIVSLIKEDGVYEKLDGLRSKFANPDITISIVAEVASGKSTFINAFIFKDNVLHSGVGAVTARIFKISYSDNYVVDSKKCKDIKELKSLVIEANKKERSEIDKKSGRYSKEVLSVCIPDPNLKKGVSVYDTPGFGSLDESVVFNVINEAIKKSDGVILLLDIHSGIKKGEHEFVRDILKVIDPKKRFIVFNKIDAVINDDMKVLYTDEQIEEEIKKVTHETLSQLSAISDIPVADINHYQVSAIKALSGFVKNDHEKIEQSQIRLFEKDFWKHVVDNKSEYLNNRISDYNIYVKSVQGILDNSIENLEGNILQVENLKNYLINQRSEITVFFNRKIDSLRNFENEMYDISLNVDEISEQVSDILRENIYNSLNDEIGFVDKLKILSLKKKYISVIEKAIKDSEHSISRAVELNVKAYIDKLAEMQNKANMLIKEINDKIQEFEGMETIEIIDILNKNASGEYEFNKESKYKDNVFVVPDVVVGAISGLIGGIIAQIIATRLLFIIPYVGWIVGGVLSVLIPVIKNKITDPHNKIATKVVSEIQPILLDKITEESKSYFEMLNSIKNVITQSSQNIQINMHNILKTLENPEEKEQIIEEMKNQVKQLKVFRSKLSDILNNKKE